MFGQCCSIRSVSLHSTRSVQHLSSARYIFGSHVNTENIKDYLPRFPFGIELIILKLLADNLDGNRLANTALLPVSVLHNLEIMTTFPIISQLRFRVRSGRTMFFHPDFHTEETCMSVDDICSVPSRYLPLRNTAVGNLLSPYTLNLFSSFSTSYLCPATLTSSSCPFSV